MNYDNSTDSVSTEPEEWMLSVSTRIDVLNMVSEDEKDERFAENLGAEDFDYLITIFEEGVYHAVFDSFEIHTSSFSSWLKEAAELERHKAARPGWRKLIVCEECHAYLRKAERFLRVMSKASGMSKQLIARDSDEDGHIEALMIMYGVEAKGDSWVIAS